jgi:hypothetical protein
MNSISYYGNVLFTPTYFGNTLGLDDPENSVRLLNLFQFFQSCSDGICLTC